MKPEHWEALRDGVVAALEAGIDAGGSSIDDYRDGRGEKGRMQERFLVHTREGEPCPGEDCDGVVERIVVSGRSTYFCPSCQVKLRRRPKRRKATKRVRSSPDSRESANAAGSVRSVPHTSLDGGIYGQGGSGGLEEHPVRRGRPDPPPLLADAGTLRGDRKGRPQAEIPLRRAGSSRSSASTSSSTKAAAT